MLASMLLVAAAAGAAQAGDVMLDNAFARVVRNGAPCARASDACRDRVFVALEDLELVAGDARRPMARGDIAVFAAGESYTPPAGRSFYEVTLKPDRPPARGPAEALPPAKNEILHDAERFFIFEERLAPGDTRPRHSHNQRVIMQLNRTRLQQWPDGGAEILVDITPDRVAFNPPVIHIVKNVGDQPLRGIVIELKP